MIDLPLGQEGRELLPDGLDDVWLDGGHERHSFCSGSVRNSPNDGASVPALHMQAIPIDAASKSRCFEGVHVERGRDYRCLYSPVAEKECSRKPGFRYLVLGNSLGLFLLALLYLR